MLHQFLEADNSTQLAVFGGRFLPVDTFNVSLKQDTEPVSSINGGKTVGTVTRMQTLDVTITTPRSPMIRNQYQLGHTIRLYREMYQLTISKIKVLEYTKLVDKEAPVSDEGWEISVSATDWVVSKR